MAEGHLVGHLREFSLHKSDWTIFKARLENYFSANDITMENGKKRRAILLNILDEDAYQLVFDLVSPEKPENKTYPQLVTVFDNHFKIQQSAFAARMKFYSAKKESNETVNQWAARLRGLAVGCEFGDELKVCLRDKFVFGFDKGPVLDRLMEEKVTSNFEEMVSLAASKSAAREIQETLIKTEPIHLVSEGRRFGNKKPGRRGKSQISANQQATHPQHLITCSVCGKENHTKDKCFLEMLLVYTVIEKNISFLFVKAKAIQNIII